jgi:AcrR family transcriptional regulator
MTAAPRQPMTTTGRRTQAERRAVTRAKLLDAAVECLTDRGYAGTSVVDVQQRAGVSRGALQHYWPSRAALVVDAVKALFDSMAARLRSDMAEQANAIVEVDPSRRIQLAIELLWSSFDSSLFRAELELWVAARHDAELRPLVVAHDRRLATEISQLCRDLFGPDLASHPHFADTIRLLTQCMRGAALVVDLHPKRRPQLVPEWHRQTCLALGVTPAAGR